MQKIKGKVANIPPIVRPPSSYPGTAFTTTTDTLEAVFGVHVNFDCPLITGPVQGSKPVKVFRVSTILVGTAGANEVVRGINVDGAAGVVVNVKGPSANFGPQETENRKSRAMERL